MLPPFKQIKLLLALSYMLGCFTALAQPRNPIFYKKIPAQKSISQTNQENGPTQMGDGDYGSISIWTDLSTTLGEEEDISFYVSYGGQTPVCVGKIIVGFPVYMQYLSSSTGITVINDTSISFDFSLESGKNFNQNIRFKVSALPGDTTERLYVTARMESALFTAERTPVSSKFLNIERPVQPKGMTKGLKWLNVKPITPRLNTGYSGNNSHSFSVDTAADGNHIYAAGMQYAYLEENIEYPDLHYVGKYTKDGLPVWERRYPSGLPYDAVIRHSADGGVVMFQNVQGSGGSTKTIVRKLDSQGLELWTAALASSQVMYHSNCLQTTKDGSILAACTWGIDVRVSKLSANGDILWTRNLSGNGLDAPACIKEAADGGILISGVTTSTSGDISGYTGPANTPDQKYMDAFILKLDSAGNKLWSHTYSLTHLDYFMSIHESSAGYSVHGFARWSPFRTDSLKNGAALWSVDLDKMGNKLREFAIPVYKGYTMEKEDGEKTFMANTQPTNDGNYIISGFTDDSYGAIKTHHGGKDIFIAKMTPAGLLLWEKQVGGTGDEECFSMILDRKGDIIFGGSTESHDDDVNYNTITAEVMLVGKIGISNSIKGSVFIDKNGNHQKDADEPFYNEGLVYAIKEGDTSISHIFNGQFLNNVDTGSYTLTYVLPYDYFTVYPANKVSSFFGFDQEDSVSFALLPKPGIRDMEVGLIALSPARPGFGSSYRIITKNRGTETIPNAVVKLAKPTTLTYLSSSRPTSAITADTISFQSRSLVAGAVDTLDINMQLATPPTLNIGDTFVLKAIALPQAGDTTPINNQATLREIAKGSFDPNDKTEAHAGIYTSRMKANGEPFQYLIRFQNTGTDTAFYVTLKDTLDSRVDIKTLKTIGSSHTYTLSIEGNIATWKFNMIKLVDSSTNEAKSHGYISFSIKPTEGLVIGDSILNKAAIYFDFNLPVITNNNRLLFVSDQSVLCPGGSTQLQAGLSGIAYQWQVNTGGGFANLSNNGTYKGTTTALLSLSKIPSGYYGYEYRCVVTTAGNSRINSDVYKLSFANAWTGAVNSAWENAANWSCGVVPDANSDVYIKSSAVRQPEVSGITAVCRSIIAGNNAHVWVKVGAKLEITGK